MKRFRGQRAIISSVFLGFGTSVALAWCADLFWSPRPPTKPVMSSTYDIGEEHFHLVTRRQLGYTFAHSRPVRADEILWQEHIRGRDHMDPPYWIDHPVLEDVLSSLTTASGWPIRCMMRNDTVGAPPRMTRRGTLTILESQGPGTEMVLPITPIWRGLAFNTLFWGVIWLSALVAIPASQYALRKRSGRCLGCGYDLRGTGDHQPCPECGNPTSATPPLPRS